MIRFPVIPYLYVRGPGGFEQEFALPQQNLWGGGMAMWMALQYRWNGEVHFGSQVAPTGAGPFSNFWSQFTGNEYLNDPATWSSSAYWSKVHDWIVGDVDATPGWNTLPQLGQSALVPEGLDYTMRGTKIAHTATDNRFEDPSWNIGSPFSCGYRTTVNDFMPAGEYFTIPPFSVGTSIAPYATSDSLPAYPRPSSPSSEPMFIWCSDFGTQPLSGATWELTWRAQVVKRETNWVNGVGINYYYKVFDAYWDYTWRLVVGNYA